MGKGKKTKSSKLATTFESEPERSEVEVEIGPAAQAQFIELPLPIQARVRSVFVRLRRWPHVSGAKPLKGDYAGSFRIRTGDYRVVFRPLGMTKLTVWKIGNRKDIYLE